MKKIDWYILKKFLGTFVFILFLLLLITVVIDVSEKIDNFLDGAVPLKEILFTYYVSFLPYIGAMLAPFFVLVACIFFTSQLADRSEIIAILNSGSSFYRMLRPYAAGAFILGGSLWFCNNYLVPYSNKKRLQFEHKYISKYIDNISLNYHRQIAPETYLFMENYRPSDAAGFKFAIDRFHNSKLVYRLRADKIEWLKNSNNWRLTNWYERTERSELEDVIRVGKLLDTSFVFKPSDFKYTENVKEEMTTPELTHYIEEMRAGGQNYIEFYEVERYRRTASAASVFIMTLIGVSVASRKVRGGLGWHLVLGIGLSALYEIIGKFSVTFSTNATLPPVLGVWIPNLIFGVLAIYLLKKAPK
ncbi:MAG: LptF/LptG family permease [Chitinophagales bacterium]